MIIFWICVAIPTLIFWWMSFKEGESVGFYFLGALFGFIAGCILWFLINVGVNVWGEKEYQHSYDYNIYAMQDNINTNSRYYASTQGEKYYHLAREGDGYKVFALQQYNTTVLETDSQPKVSCYNLEFTNEFLKKHFTVMSLYNEETYKMYIPKGSIKFDFNMDLKN